MLTWLDGPSAPRPRRLLALGEGLGAVAAIGGAVAMMVGAIDFGDTIDHRLPFGSLVFGGVALLLVVGIPMAIAAVLSWSGSDHGDVVAVGAGVLLVGWIVVELAFIRSISVLHPICLVAGTAIAYAGYRGIRRRPHDAPGGPDTSR